MRPRRFTTTSLTREKSWPNCFRARSRCAFIADCLKITASFFGAQMSAMDNATRNAGEMVQKYTLRYNRTRQAMITKELIEIISGAEAV